jgi:hypothetical protein
MTIQGCEKAQKNLGLICFLDDTDVALGAELTGRNL